MAEDKKEMSGHEASAEEFRVHNGLTGIEPGVPYDPTKDTELTVASEPEGGYGGEGEGKGAIGVRRPDDVRTPEEEAQDIADSAQATAEAFREGAAIPDEDKETVFPDPDVVVAEPESTSGNKSTSKGKGKGGKS